MNLLETWQSVREERSAAWDAATEQVQRLCCILYINSSCCIVATCYRVFVLFCFFLLVGSSLRRERVCQEGGGKPRSRDVAKCLPSASDAVPLRTYFDRIFAARAPLSAVLYWFAAIWLQGTRGYEHHPLPVVIPAPAQHHKSDKCPEFLHGDFLRWRTYLNRRP